MRKRFLTPLLALIAYVGVMSAADQNSLKVVLLDGQESAYALSLIGRLEFNSDSLFLVGADGSILGREHKDNIRVIAFSEEGTEAISTIEIENGVQIYPNPVQQILVIKGAKEGDMIRIYSLNGHLLFTTKAVGDVTTIDVNSIQSGQYLIQVNALIMKLLKQ